MGKEPHYLKELLNHLKLSAKKFAESIEKDPNVIYHVLRGRNGVSEQLAETIHRKYNYINYNWLLYGRGSMLLSDSVNALRELPLDYSALETSDSVTFLIGEIKRKNEIIDDLRKKLDERDKTIVRFQEQMELKDSDLRFKDAALKSKPAKAAVGGKDTRQAG